MTRRVVLFALVCTCATGIFLLAPQFARASQSVVEKTARVGFVGTETLSTGGARLLEAPSRTGLDRRQEPFYRDALGRGPCRAPPDTHERGNRTQGGRAIHLWYAGRNRGQKATTTVPIVAAMMGDPLGTGLVTSLARPGTNLTGISLAMSEGLGGKWMQLLHEAVPRLVTVAIIGNPASPWVPKRSLNN